MPPSWLPIFRATCDRPWDEWRELTGHNLLLIRHAPTKANSDGRFMGQRDAPVSDSAFADARRSLAGIADKRGVTHLYSSPLQRAMATASLVSDSLEIVADERLIERDLGEWQGELKSDIVRGSPEVLLPSGHLSAKYTPPGGETLDDLVQRILSFLGTIGRLPPGNVPMAVTHNGWIRCAQYVCGLISAEEIYLEPTPHAQVIELALPGHVLTDLPA